jgi:hypothetical protein
MSFRSSLESALRAGRFAFGAALLSTSAGPLAAPATVQPFGPQTWGDLQRAGAKPQVVVFSTTDCSHCPAVIDGLATSLRKSALKPRLVVVVMDGAGQEAELLADRHYRQADALHAFDGDAVNLRYRVNPDWRGLTPYVVLLPAGGGPRYFNSAPPAGALRALLHP